MSLLKKILLVFLLSYSASTLAASLGASFSYALSSREPENLHGYQLMLEYDPDLLKWQCFDIYFDGGFSHFWVNHWPHYQSINIYSIAPVARYRFKKYQWFTPYLELSIGLAYLNRTRIEKRNLGIHFAFQDRIGAGVLLLHDQLSLGIEALHYSNAHLSEHNSGITIPLVLDISYHFDSF